MRIIDRILYIPCIYPVIDNWPVNFKWIIPLRVPQTSRLVRPPGADKPQAQIPLWRGCREVHLQNA